MYNAIQSSTNAARIITYVLRGDGSRDSRCEYASGIGCSARSAVRDFEDTRTEYDPQHRLKIEAYSEVMSASREEFDPDDGEQVHQFHLLAVETAKVKYPGRQVLVGTQIDGKTGLCHAHIVVSNIAHESASMTHTVGGQPVTEQVVAGKPFTSAMSNVFRIRAATNEVLADESVMASIGYQNARLGELMTSRAGSDGTTFRGLIGEHAYDNHELVRVTRNNGGWLAALKARIATARDRAVDEDDFKRLLTEDGSVVLTERGQRRTWSYTYTSEDGKTRTSRAGSNRLHAGDFSREAIVSAIQARQDALEQTSLDSPKVVGLEARPAADATAFQVRFPDLGRITEDEVAFSFLDGYLRETSAAADASTEDGKAPKISTTENAPATTREVPEGDTMPTNSSAAPTASSPQSVWIDENERDQDLLDEQLPGWRGLSREQLVELMVKQRTDAIVAVRRLEYLVNLPEPARDDIAAWTRYDQRLQDAVVAVDIETRKSQRPYLLEHLAWGELSYGAKYGPPPRDEAAARAQLRADDVMRDWIKKEESAAKRAADAGTGRREEPGTHPSERPQAAPLAADALRQQRRGQQVYGGAPFMLSYAANALGRAKTTGEWLAALLLTVIALRQQLRTEIEHQGYADHGVREPAAAHETPASKPTSSSQSGPGTADPSPSGDESANDSHHHSNASAQKAEKGKNAPTKIRAFAGHVFTDEETENLLAGDEVVIEATSPKTGASYVVAGRYGAQTWKDKRGQQKTTYGFVRDTNRNPLAEARVARNEALVRLRSGLSDLGLTVAYEDQATMISDQIEEAERQYRDGYISGIDLFEWSRDELPATCDRFLSEVRQAQHEKAL